MELHTPRLTLREFTAADADAVHAFASDPRVVEFQAWGPNTRQDTLAFLAAAAEGATALPRRHYTLAVTTEADGVIGSIGLTLGAAEAELGYTLARPHWGRGYASEAGRALVGFALDELRLPAVTATARPDNVASLAVLGKLGLQPVGRREHDVLIRGVWRDSVLLRRAAP